MGTHAAAAAGVDDELHRQELCLGWIYEFFARHRMEEAQEGAWGRASRPHDRSSKFAVLLARMRRQRPRRAAWPPAARATRQRGQASATAVCAARPRALRAVARPRRRPARHPAPWRCARARADATCLARARRPVRAHARVRPCSADQERREKIPRLARVAAKALGPDLHHTAAPRKGRGAPPSARESVSAPAARARSRFWRPRCACRAPLTPLVACSLSWRTKSLMYGSRTSSRMWARSCTPKHCSRSPSNWRCSPFAPRAGKTTSMRLPSGAPSHAAACDMLRLRPRGLRHALPCACTDVMRSPAACPRTRTQGRGRGGGAKRAQSARSTAVF